MIEPKDILFLGMDKTAVFWYRCALPALHMGADWCGVFGEPPHIEVATGMVRGGTATPRFADYKVVIMQQPEGPRWLRLIRELQGNGVKVIFEIDDYIHGVRKQVDHNARDWYTKKRLQQIELNMRVADALCVSTEYLARRYASINPKIYLVENALDVARYRLTRPERDSYNVGWAGAAGHTQAIMPWLGAVARIMVHNEHVKFVAIGQPHFADPFRKNFGPERAIAVPWTLIENYPAAMTLLDVALAPAGKSSWWRGKSDLRWLEAGALGIPTIASPQNYSRIAHGVDGFHADTADEVHDVLAELVANPGLGPQVGAVAREYVNEQRNIGRNAGNWLEMCRHLADGEGEGVTTLR